VLRPRLDRIRDRLGTSVGRYRLDECVRCGLGLINPAPTGDLSPYYPGQYLSQEAGEDGGGGGRPEGLLSRAERWYRYDQYRFDFGILRRAAGVDVGEVASYVDIGCGSGERVAYAHRRGCPRAVGVDRYRFGKSSARRGVELVTTEIADFRPREKFQVVSMFHVLEHVEDPVAVLAHLRDSVVSSDGVLVVQVPNYGCRERRLFGRRWFGLDVPRHLYQFDARTLRLVLRAAGFDVVDVRAVNAPLHPVTLVPSLLPALDVQRIWTRPGSLLSKVVAQVAWAAVTALVLPVTWLQNATGSGSMLTAVARPDRSVSVQAE
jgi:SAM-dependent methyltransferase